MCRINVSQTFDQKTGFVIFEHNEEMANGNVNQTDANSVPNVNDQMVSEKDVAQKVDKGEISGKDFIAHATCEKLSKTAEVLFRESAERSQGFFSKSTVTAVGRFFMGLVHGAKSLLCGDVFRPSWWKSNMDRFSKEAQFNLALEPRRKLETQYEPNIRKVIFGGTRNIQTCAIGGPEKFDKYTVAAMTGFKIKTVEKNGGVYPADQSVTIKNFKGKLYPNGVPCIKDVVQNPELQDCWFLSSITALLRTQGPKAISRLITKNKETGGWNVRLGTYVYHVPNGEVCVNGKSCTSNSAPWVKVLEQALAMHDSMDVENNDAKLVTIVKGDVLYKGLKLLQGHDGRSSESVVCNFSAKQNTPYRWRELKLALQQHIPVVIGHVANSITNDTFTKIYNTTVGVLRDNISPGHAVALMDVEQCGDDTALLTVMDPYGKIRIIPSSALDYCSVAMGCSNNDYEGIKDKAQNEWMTK